MYNTCASSEKIKAQNGWVTYSQGLSPSLKATEGYWKRESQFSLYVAYGGLPVLQYIATMYMIVAQSGIGSLEKGSWSWWGKAISRGKEEQKEMEGRCVQ